MSAFFAAAALALATQAPTEPLPERERTLGEALIGDWELWAMMKIDHSGSQPVIEDILCDMDRRGLELTTGIVGGLRMRLEDNAEFQRRDVRAIGLGDNVWEYRWKSYEPAEWQFADVAYPAPRVVDAPCDGIHGNCRIVENGTALIRRSASEPWLSFDTLGNELLRATTLRVGVHDGADDDPTAIRWTQLPLGDLPEALAWCQSTMRADVPRRLHRR